MFSFYIVFVFYACYSNEAIVHVLLNIPEPIFLYGIVVGENRQTGNYYRSLIEEVVSKYNKTAAVITDNAKAMVNAGEAVEKAHGHICHIQCACHIIHLLIKEVVCRAAAPKVLLKNCVMVVRCIKEKHVPYAKFLEKKKNSSMLKASLISSKG